MVLGCCPCWQWFVVFVSAADHFVVYKMGFDTCCCRRNIKVSPRQTRSRTEGPFCFDKLLGGSDRKQTQRASIPAVAREQQNLRLFHSDVCTSSSSYSMNLYTFLYKQYSLVFTCYEKLILLKRKGFWFSKNTMTSTLLRDIFILNQLFNFIVFYRHDRRL